MPVDDLLGEQDKGFSYLGQQPSAGATVDRVRRLRPGCRGRSSSPRSTRRIASSSAPPVAHFQNTKFELAACQAEVDAAQAVADRALEALDAGELTAAEAASAKLFCTEVAAPRHRPLPAAARRLRLHVEYPIARLYADNRVNRIYGGTSEVMKMIIAKDMGL